MVIANPKTLYKKSKTHSVTEVCFDTYDVTSGSSDNIYRVWMQQSGGAQCNCYWGSKGGFRLRHNSGCSHVQAVYAYIHSQDNRSISSWIAIEDAKRQKRPIVHIGDGVILTTRAI